MQPLCFRRSSPSGRGWRRASGWFTSVVLALGALLVGSCSSGQGTAKADRALDEAIAHLIRGDGAPPGIAVAIQRGNAFRLHVGGVADVATQSKIDAADSMRLASVAKAFSGATALSLVASGSMTLQDTIGERLPGMPAAWSNVTLRELLAHTSGIPDFSKSPAFVDALRSSLSVAPAPRDLLGYVEGEPLEFTPGSKYQYSNSDNIVAALMVESVAGRPYEAELDDRVLKPLGLSRTNLPRGTEMAAPLLRGYDIEPGQPPQDVTELLAAGWTWSSGGVVSTAADATRFVRAYASGAAIGATLRAQQFHFIPGASEPSGPGVNAAGLAIFRYQTSCGTVYGHTGNTLGYTQFVAATSDGKRSATVSVTAQITPNSNQERFSELHHVFELAVCAATAG